jgi:hypothetical protein
MHQSIADLKLAFEPVSSAVQERSSATVSASKMPEDKLGDLRQAVSAIVLPVNDESSDELQALYSAPPQPGSVDW